jgi:hypothetical protein
MNVIINQIAAYHFKKLAAMPRKKEFIKLGDAKSIGIVFDATEKETFETIKKFVARLKEVSKGVHAIGYVDGKITPNYSYPKTDFDLFNKKELRSFYRPQSPYIKTFIEDEKDILIDANLSGKLPLQYLAVASRAKCKAGIHSAENEPFFDVLLAIKREQGLNFFLEQSLKYLS